MLDDLFENLLHAKSREFFVELLLEPHYPLALPVAFTTAIGFTTIRAIDWHRKKELEEEDFIVVYH
jgi:hypothetical protein